MDPTQPDADAHEPPGTTAEDVLAKALAALAVWATLSGIEPARALSQLAGLVVGQRVCALLGLQLAKSGLQTGWDARDAAGRTYQVKARALVERRDTSFDLASQLTFDEALLVLYDPSDLALIEVWRMDRDTVLRCADRDPSRLALRWPRSRQFAKLVFARDVV
jgi:hypothetical protein